MFPWEYYGGHTTDSLSGLTTLTQDIWMLNDWRLYMIYDITIWLWTYSWEEVFLLATVTWTLVRALDRGEVRLSLCCNYCLLLIQTEIILQDRSLLHSHTIFTILIVKPHFCPDRLGRRERVRFASTIYYFHDNLIRFQLNEINPKVALLDSVHQPMYGNVERTFNQMDLKQIKLLNQNIMGSF